MIQWILGQSTLDESTINNNFNLIVDSEPKLPETTSNLHVSCYRNKARTLHVPIKVKWFRMKNSVLTEVVGMRGRPIYPCEPSDLGCKIKAQITSDQEKGKAQVWFGPVKIDIKVKIMLEKILHYGNKFPILTIHDDVEKEARLELKSDVIVIRDNHVDKQIRFEYSLIEPRIEFSPKDITKVYLRFQAENSEQAIADYITNVYDQKSKNKQSKIFRYQKIEVKFDTRISRDTFIFGIKAFATKRELTNSFIIEKLQKIDLTNEQVFKKFFEFESFKSDINRLKEIAADREQKMKDIKVLEEEICELTQNFKRFIEQKCQLNKIDLNESYAQLSMRHDEIKGRNRHEELEKQNSNLKMKIQELNDQIEVMTLFKRENDSIMQSRLNINDSMVQPKKEQMPINPFGKKGIRVYEESKPNAVMAVNQMNMKLLQQNNKLRLENSRIERDREFKSHNDTVHNLLDSLNDDDTVPKARFNEINRKLTETERALKVSKGAMAELEKQVSQLKLSNSKLVKEVAELNDKIVNKSIEHSRMLNNTYVQDLNHSANHSMANISMSSEAELMLLDQKVTEIRLLNDKILKENANLVKENQRYRQQIQMLNTLLKKQKSMHDISYEESELARCRQQVESLEAERNMLSKKYETLAKESAQVKKYYELERKYEELFKSHQICGPKIKMLTEEVDFNKRQTLRESHVYIDESSRLKEINVSLNTEIMALKKEIQMRNNHEDYQSTQTLTRKIFELEKELQYLRQGSHQNINQQLSSELFNHKKQLDKYKREAVDKDMKIKSLNSNIEKLINEMHERTENSVNISALNESVTHSIDKYKQRIKQLEQDIKTMRKNNVALNKSRDLINSFEEHNSAQLDQIRREMDNLIEQNENISQMCQKYSSELTKLKIENANLRKRVADLENK